GSRWSRAAPALDVGPVYVYMRAQHDEAENTRDGTQRERPTVTAQRGDTAREKRAKPSRQLEERRKRAYYRTTFRVGDVVEREQQQRGIHQRHARGKHDGANDESRDRRPCRDDANPRASERERKGCRRARAESVWDPCADDPNEQNEYAVEQENRA